MKILSTFLLVILVLFTVSFLFASPGKIIKRTFVADLNDINNKSMETDPDILRLKNIIEEKKEIDINQWIRENFLKTGTSFDKIPLENNHHDLAFDIHHPDGIYFKSGNNKLHYWEEACKVFDCYKPYLSLINASGEVIWKRRVPFVYVPVYPFACGNFILYISKDEDEYFLVVINLSNGNVVEKDTLPSDNDVSFSLTNPVETFPVCINGNIVVQGCVVHHARSIRDPDTYSPSDFIMLEMETGDMK